MTTINEKNFFEGTEAVFKEVKESKNARVAKMVKFIELKNKMDNFEGAKTASEYRKMKKELENLFGKYSTGFLKIDKNVDYVSNSGSMYIYDNKGVYRISNHWGAGVASCAWFLNDKKRLWVEKFTLAFAKFEKMSPLNTERGK